MKKTLRLVLSLCAVVGIGFSTAHQVDAQAGCPAPITLTAPERGADLGRSFTIAGTTHSQESSPNLLTVIIDGVTYDSDAIGRPAPEQNGSFSFSFTVPATVANGEHSLAVGQLGECDNTSNTVAINIGASQPTATPEPSATPTSTPTPTVAATPVPPEAGTGWLDNLDPALVLAIGAVAGGGATGIAEYSWIRYKRRHKGSGLVK